MPKGSSLFDKWLSDEGVKCSFSNDFAFNMSIWCSKRTTQPETRFFSVDFVVIIVYLYFLFDYMQKKKVAFTCVNPLLFLLIFIIFIILLRFGVNFKLNFDLNFNTISLFHLDYKISFGFLPMKEKSLGLLELVSKM